MSGKALTISKPQRKKKGKTLRSPRPTTHRQTKEERKAVMDDIEKFFEEHNIHENVRETQEKKKGRKTRKFRRN